MYPCELTCDSHTHVAHTHDFAQACVLDVCETSAKLHVRIRFERHKEVPQALRFGQLLQLLHARVDRPSGSGVEGGSEEECTDKSVSM
jgi:hypothetical protein